MFSECSGQPGESIRKGLLSYRQDGRSRNRPALCAPNWATKCATATTSVVDFPNVLNRRGWVRVRAARTRKSMRIGAGRPRDFSMVSRDQFEMLVRARAGFSSTFTAGWPKSPQSSRDHQAVFPGAVLQNFWLDCAPGSLVRASSVGGSFRIRSCLEFNFGLGNTGMQLAVVLRLWLL